MKLIADPAVPQGQFDGYDADGILISRKTLSPVFKQLLGTATDEDRVVEWRVSPEGRRRITAAALWVACGAETAGNA